MNTLSSNVVWISFTELKVHMTGGNSIQSKITIAVYCETQSTEYNAIYWIMTEKKMLHSSVTKFELVTICW